MLRLFFVAGLLLLTPLSALAATPRTLTYTFDHHILYVSVVRHPEWKEAMDIWTYRGVEALPPVEVLEAEEVPEGWKKEKKQGWNTQRIAETIEKEVAFVINREAGEVVIRMTGSGAVEFEGHGLTGQHVDVQAATKLTIMALENGVDSIRLPVEVTQPKIDVQSKELIKMGISEVVTIGESVYKGSPPNRRHNIGVGVDTFNGHIIPKDTIFSFVEHLGPVNHRTGYRKELVIQGDTTIPDYGGGLCQVSTTSYRGPWEYGLPITQRKNHSYAVSYYSPQGTDATIYPPNVDIKFLNDTPAALLVQSFTDDNDHAYFIYYGTKDERRTEVFGPYVYERKAAPAYEKIVYTTEIPPGEKRPAGERHDGMKVLWYRSIDYGTGSTIEKFHSTYQARPITFQVGVTADEFARLQAGGAPAGEGKPSWIGE